VCGVNVVDVLWAIAVGFFLFLGLVVYIIARQRAVRFLLQAGVGLLAAYLLHLAGWSEVMAFIGAGMTLSLAYFMGK
jgi:hypothetical protein